MKLFLGLPSPRYFHVVHRTVLPCLVEAGRSRVPGTLRACPGLYRDCFTHARNDDEGSGGVVPHILNSHTVHWATYFTRDHFTTKNQGHSIDRWLGGTRGQCGHNSQDKNSSSFRKPNSACPGPMPNQYRHLTDYWIMLKIFNESLKFDTIIWTAGWCFTVLRYASLWTTRKCVLTNSADISPNPWLLCP